MDGVKTCCTLRNYPGFELCLGIYWRGFWKQFRHHFQSKTYFIVDEQQVLGYSWTWIDLIVKWMHVIQDKRRPLPSGGEHASPGVADAQFQLITAWVVTERARLGLAWDRQLVIHSPSPLVPPLSPEPPLSALVVRHWRQSLCQAWVILELCISLSSLSFPSLPSCLLEPRVRAHCCLRVISTLLSGRKSTCYHFVLHPSV